MSKTDYKLLYYKSNYFSVHVHYKIVCSMSIKKLA